MRCGPGGPVSGKLNLPALSALVVAATSMVVVRLMRMTSSPAAGLLVVPLVTVPVRVWAAAEARATDKMLSRRANFASWVKRTPSDGGTMGLRNRESPLVNYDSRHSGRLYRCFLF